MEELSQGRDQLCTYPGRLYFGALQTGFVQYLSHSYLVGLELCQRGMLGVPTQAPAISLVSTERSQGQELSPRSSCPHNPEHSPLTCWLLCDQATEEAVWRDLGYLTPFYFFIPLVFLCPAQICAQLTCPFTQPGGWRAPGPCPTSLVPFPLTAGVSLRGLGCFVLQERLSPEDARGTLCPPHTPS